MKILNWNIRWGGKSLEGKIVEHILLNDADLVVLTEFKNNDSGEIIRNDLAKNYPFFQYSSNERNKNGVAIFSKNSIILRTTNFVHAENILEFEFENINFIATFCANDDITQDFISYVLTKKTEVSTVIIGDLNAGPRGSNIDRYDGLSDLAANGFVDIWRLLNSGIFWSYRYDNKKSQPDHCFSSDDLAVRFESIEFVYNVIDEKISDHAIMICELK
jgi:exonuclease III